jgi:hypothetical protein
MSSCTAMHIGELAGKCVPLSSVCSELDSADSAVVWYMLQKLSFYPGGVNLLLLPGLKEPARLLHLVPDGAARAGVLVVVDLRLHLPVAVLCLAEVPVAPQGRGQDDKAARRRCTSSLLSGPRWRWPCAKGAAFRRSPWESRCSCGRERMASERARMAGCYFGDCDGETIGRKDLLIVTKFSKINLFSETVGDALGMVSLVVVCHRTIGSHHSCNL